jgi:uncharacterized membrane protein YphA (DoxX/SURF4 family)
MDRLYSRFPGGGVGFGLLLLRLILAAWFFQTGVPMFNANPAAFLCAFVFMSAALLLAAGLVTSMSAVIGAVCLVLSLLAANQPIHWFPVLALAGLSGSLALLGPGGYSLDARLSGWRTIDLSSRN